MKKPGRHPLNQAVKLTSPVSDDLKSYADRMQ